MTPSSGAALGPATTAPQSETHARAIGAPLETIGEPLKSYTPGSPVPERGALGPGPGPSPPPSERGGPGPGTDVAPQDIEQGAGPTTSAEEALDEEPARQTGSSRGRLDQLASAARLLTG